LSIPSEPVARAFAAMAAGRSSSAADITIGLVGRGIGSSLSPVMHEREGRRLGLSYAYHLIDFDRLGFADADLPAVIAAASTAGFAGLNVTYPFKQAVLPFLDALAPEAATIGAVNTVVLRDGRRVGHNTDCWGFAESFRRGLGDVPVDRVVQFGSGGAGAAVAQALRQLGVGSLEIFDTDAERARSLAEKLSRRFGADVVPISDPARAMSQASGVVNATPVGMLKYPGTPFDIELLQPRQWIADVVYFPRETELITQGRALGCRVLPGGGMAVYQAVRAFELFTGIAADGEAMARTFEAAAA
jgi:shikimate dehydrogenase